MMQKGSHRPRVVLSVTNCICFDQRVLKIAETINHLNVDITIIGRRRGTCCNTDIVPFRAKRFRMIFKNGFLFYAFYNFRLFIHLLLHRYDILVANDLDTLLPNFLVSKLKGLPLVYDSHEYFTGLPEIQHRSFVKWVWTSLEKAILPRLKYVITVSEPIAKLYKKLYDVEPLVVRNMARNTDHIVPFTPVDLGIKPDELLVIIQGTGINVDKGAEELIDAINLTERIFLLVIGSGDLIPQLKEKARNASLDSRVRFIPPLSWEKLAKYTKSAHAGMCLEKNTNLNYLYSLPNKLFDYIAAGIPVIAGSLPESELLIKEYNFGLIIENVTPEAISTALTTLRDNRKLLEELKLNAIKAANLLSWEKESTRVVELYTNVLNNFKNRSNR